MALFYKEWVKANMTTAERIEKALALKSDGQYDEALQVLRELLAEEPSNAEGRHQCGLVLGFTGDFDQSLQELKQAVVLAPDNALIRNDLALTFTMLGMYEEAKLEFSAVLQNDQQNQVALRNLTYFK
jgi:Flp pilus assembly protein TadD